MSYNPIIEDDFSLLTGHGIPNFKNINAHKINNQIPELLDSLNNRFYEIEKDLANKIHTQKALDWHEVMIPLNLLSEQLRWSWGAVCHLNAVKNTPELREAHANQQPEIIRFCNRLGQSKIIYKSK